MKLIVQTFTVLLGSLIVAAGFNWFLIPHQLLSGGVSGIALMIGYLTHWNIPLLFLALNIPLMVWGLLAIGKLFIVLSTVSVIVTSWLLQLIPVVKLAQEPMLSAVAGGVLIGIGAGISMRSGGSTGGFDVVGSILTRRRDFPLGTVLFALNGIVVLALGYFKQDWDLALDSILSIFVSGKVMDTIHIKHLKVTAFIVTRHKDAMIEKLMQVQRGVTVIRSEGAFTKSPQDVLMTVTTRYELSELRTLVKRTDPDCFVNIVETVGVIGQFRR